MAESQNRDQENAVQLLEKVHKLQKKRGHKLEEKQQKKLQDAIDKLEKQMEKKRNLAKSLRELESLSDVLFAKKTKGSGGFVEHFKVIFTALLIALVLRTFVVEPFKIPSGSMIPTLAIGDHIFVNKFSYGLWLPFVQEKWRMGSGPKRGDVIVFINPVDPSRDMVKRVVGLPGDTIEVKDNVVYVNNTRLQQSKKGSFSYLDRESPRDSWHTQTATRYNERLFNVEHPILRHHKTPSPLRNWSALKDARKSARPWGPQIKPGFVFVMGDNRDRSSDSRDWGLVPMKNIKGRAFLIWLSYGGGKGFRWKRIFTSIR